MMFNKKEYAFSMEGFNEAKLSKVDKYTNNIKNNFINIITNPLVKCIIIQGIVCIFVCGLLVGYLGLMSGTFSIFNLPITAYQILR